jgi:DNA-binding transcriptional MerR regulator
MLRRRKTAASRPVDDSKKHYGISELSKEFNVTPRTIRHYEDEGLLEPARRGQMRLFTEEDRARLEIVLVGARLGIHLSSLRELFDLYDNTRSDEKRKRQLLELLGQQREALKKQQADILRMTAELDRMEQRYVQAVEKKLEVKRDRQQQDLFG